MARKQTGPAPARGEPLTAGANRKHKNRRPFAGSKAAEASPAGRATPSRALIAAMCLALGLATLAVYAQTYWHNFVAYDDDLYVYRNPVVKLGLTPSSVAWAFGTFHCSNWHPLTWLSHLLDCRLFGLNAGAHHLVNVGFHLANSLLLFIAFVRMTRRPWASALVAGVFAVHPLHVESVAWVSERKDVLSTFLGLVALLFYIRYTRRPTVLAYVPVALTFALALMAKPMLVTFPFVLLLVDVWPLGRLAWPPPWRALRPKLWEKAPLFALAAGGSVSTFVAQQTTGAVLPLAGLSLSGRLVNACIGYGSYLRKAFFPTELGVFYPGRTPSAAIAALAFVILLGATLAVFAFARRHPSCPVGWFWFLGMLVPVSGIVQVGTQSTADRYMYLPLVGLSIAVIWPVAELLTPHRFIRRAAAVIACTVLVLLGVQAFRQVTYWKSSRTLFEHTLAVTADNYIMHNNLGVILAQEGKFAEAVAHYRQAVAINPNYEDAHGNLGHELLRAGDLEGAYTHLARSVEIWPNNARFQADLADVLVRQGKFPEAQRPLEEAIRLAPEKSEYHSNLGYVLQKLGRTDEAIARYAEAIRLKPDSADAHYNMGLALAAKGKTSEAAAEMSKAAALNPDYANPGLLLEQLQTRR